MVSLASSRETLIANVAQQVSAVAVLLILPNILTTSAFSETVYVAVVMSFIALADLGMSYVYARIVPAMSGRREVNCIAQWDQTICSFGLVTSLIFACGASFSYYWKFGSMLNALLLFPIAPLVFLTSFYLTRVSSLGDFVSYRRIVVSRAMLTIAVLPIVFFWGVTGWFVGTLVAAFILFLYSRESAIPLLNKIDWHLVCQNIWEGVLRCGISILWLQLLNVGRLYASVHYDYKDLANYGIVASAYNSLAAIVIAILLPVSVETMRRFGHGAENAIKYVNDIGVKVGPWILLSSIIVAEISHLLFPVLFPDYQPDPITQASLLFGILFYPFFIIAGNCLIGSRRFFPYISLLLFGLTTAWLVATYFDNNTRGAAIAQLIGLMIYSVLMYTIIPNVLGVPYRLWLRTIFGFILTVGLGAAYWVLRWLPTSIYLHSAVAD